MAATPPPYQQLPKTLLLLPVVYVLSITAVLLSPRLQTLLTYFHYFRPPTPPSLKPHRLSAHARSIRQQHLHGWHVLPSGPPFPSANADFIARLAAPQQRVVVFFHGTSGTRAFPSTRVALVKLFSAHLAAHVVVFDYSGYAESRGTPSEKALAQDARLVYQWVLDSVHESTQIIIYGMSLGSFPALTLAAMDIPRKPSCVVTDSALSSLLDAVMTHPAGIPFRLFPYARSVYHRFLAERLDNVENIRKVAIPVLIMHGADDGMVDIAQGRRLYNTAVESGNKSVEFVSFSGCGHNDIASAEEYLTVLWRFVEKCSRGEMV